MNLPLLNRTVLPICSIEVSPHGDLLDERKGSAAGGFGESRGGGQDHERRGGAGLAAECPADGVDDGVADQAQLRVDLAQAVHQREGVDRRVGQQEITEERVETVPGVRTAEAGF
jgi:hypothetical protein